MSTPTKLHGGSESELTKLKGVWKKLSDDAKGFWRDLFSSETKQSEIRRQLFAKLQVNLRWDKQLTVFRAWVDDQDARDTQAERMEENEQRIKDQHPEWSLDQVRDEVLRQSYFETLAAGDFKTGLKTVTAHLNVKRTDLEERRIKVLEKKAAAFDRAQAAIAEAKNSKGGITPETLTRIEQELRLL